MTSLAHLRRIAPIRGTLGDYDSSGRAYDLEISVSVEVEVLTLKLYALTVYQPASYSQTQQHGYIAGTETMAKWPSIRYDYIHRISYPYLPTNTPHRTQPSH